MNANITNDQVDIASCLSIEKSQRMDALERVCISLLRDSAVGESHSRRTSIQQYCDGGFITVLTTLLNRKKVDNDEMAGTFKSFLLFIELLVLESKRAVVTHTHTHVYILTTLC